MSNPTLAEIDTAIAEAQRHAADAYTRYGLLAEDVRKQDRQIAEGIKLDAALAAQAVSKLYKGWDRWYIVQNTNGHIHKGDGSGTACPTLYASTLIAWLPELSGQSETDLVAKYGEAVCTICVPEAPVYYGFEDGTSELATWASAVKIAENAAKDEKRAKADAEKIVATVYDSSYTNTPRPKTFKTERAATNYVSSQLASIALYGGTHPRNDQWVADVRAIAATGVDLAKSFENQIKKAEKAIRDVEKDHEDAAARYGDAIATPADELRATREAGRDALVSLRDEVGA